MDRRKMSLLPLCVLLAMALAGCWAGDSGLGGYLTGESYPDAERYQSGGFSYDPSQIERVELYWRAGEVELVESEEETLSVQESGEALTGDSAMRWLLEDGVLRLRFCASGARIGVSAADKRLHLELPKGIDLSLHTSSAAVRAETLEQDEILIATLSSGMDIDESLDMCENLLENEYMREKLSLCRKEMADGKPFVDALDNTGMFSAVNMRMINIAFSTGTLDRTMATIAENAEKKVSAVIQTSVARFEPTMVIIMAVAVGFILLSVMIPLMSVMTVIG